MADRNTKIRKGQLGDASVEPIDLEATGGADTTQVPSLGNDGKFLWVDLPVVVAFGIFELDSNGDLMPIVGTELDTYYELDGNDDIQPKE